MYPYRQTASAGLSAALLVLMASYDPAVAQSSSYSPEELQKARVFIEKNFEPKKKAMLESLATKAGKKPEEMFLDIGKLTGDTTLGESSHRPKDPDDDGDTGNDESKPADPVKPPD